MTTSFYLSDTPAPDDWFVVTLGEARKEGLRVVVDLTVHVTPGFIAFFNALEYSSYKYMGLLWRTK